MRIPAQTIALVQTLRDLISQDEDHPAKTLAIELSKLPDFENARVTAGYYVTPDGDIVSDHWWLMMDDDSVFDVQDEPVHCSKKDPRRKHYFPYPGNKGLPVEVLTLADHLKAVKRTSNNKSFTEMAQAYVQPEGVSDRDLDAIERFADRLFSRVGIDVAFSRHFRQRVNDVRNERPITPAELIRLFKQEYQKHGKRIARLGPDASAVLKDMSTAINVPFVMKWDRGTGMLDLLTKTVMRKPDFGTSDPVFAIEQYNEYDDPGDYEPQEYVIPAGTELYHGTSSEDWDEVEEDIYPPFWVTENEYDAQYFVSWNKQGGQGRIIRFRSTQPLKLILFNDRNDMDEFAEHTGIDMDFPHDAAEDMCSRGYDGWVVPGNYQYGGSDIMMCSTTGIEYVGTESNNTNEASGASPSSDAARQSSVDMPDNMTMNGKEGVPHDGFDDEVRPEDMQLGWQNPLDEDESGVHKFYFEPGFPQNLQQMILSKQFNDPTVYCQDESLRWALNLERNGVPASVVEGEYLDTDDEHEMSHTWVSVGGYIFDPTATQFIDWPNIDLNKYQSMEEHDPQDFADLGYCTVPTNEVDHSESTQLGWEDLLDEGERGNSIQFQVEQHLQDGLFRIGIFVDGNRVGEADAGKNDHDDSLHIEHLGIDDEYQGQGYGRAAILGLMQFLGTAKTGWREGPWATEKAGRFWKKMHQELDEDVSTDYLPATPENIERAKEFVWEKWKERALEMQRNEPTDLSTACKFASMFAHMVFGGEVRGNWHHQFVELDNDILDLTSGRSEFANPEYYRHDKKFWRNKDHRESMASCEPRVSKWAKEFKSLREVDHPEFMPGGDETHGYSGHDPTYDERSVQTNPGHPRP